MEEMEELKSDTLKIKGFLKEINKTYDEKIDNCLTEIIDKNNLEHSEIGYWLRQFACLLKK